MQAITDSMINAHEEKLNLQEANEHLAKAELLDAQQAKEYIDYLLDWGLPWAALEKLAGSIVKYAYKTNDYKPRTLALLTYLKLHNQELLELVSYKRATKDFIRYVYAKKASRMPIALLATYHSPIVYYKDLADNYSAFRKISHAELLKRTIMYEAIAKDRIAFFYYYHHMEYMLPNAAYAIEKFLETGRIRMRRYYWDRMQRIIMKWRALRWEMKQGLGTVIASLPTRKEVDNAMFGRGHSKSIEHTQGNDGNSGKVVSDQLWNSLKAKVGQKG